MKIIDAINYRIKTRKNRIKTSKGDKVFVFFVYFFMALIGLITLYPVFFVIIASFSSGNAVATGKVFFYPVNFNINGYISVFKNNEILSGYAWTIFISTLGTFLNLFMTIPLAFVISRKDFMARNVVLWIFLVTMYFSGGLIPTYIWIDTIGLNNNLLIFFLPWLISPFHLIVCRTFFNISLPEEIVEAAKIDGCSNTLFFLKIALPLSKPIIAVIALYCFVGRWNDWFTPLVYLSGNEFFTGDKIRPLPLVLRNLLVLAESISSGGASTGVEVEAALVIRYAVIVVSTLPVMCFYPFVQKHFTQGVMVGSLKG